MKVILQQDVKGQGKKGQMIEASDGYARNFLLPRKLAVPATAENGFLPMPDEAPHADIVYICSPNNPTGAAYTRDQLKAWVEYARKNNAIILYDAAYECFISDGELARSIFSPFTSSPDNSTTHPGITHFRFARETSCLSKFFRINSA